MNPEPLIPWPRPLLELLEFVGAFLAAGAVGFRLLALRPWIGPESEIEVRDLGQAAARRSAALGLLGALIVAGLLAWQLPQAAARRELTIPALLAGNAPLALQVVLAPLAVLGFGLAWGGARWGFALAALAVLVAPFRGALTGQWPRLVNPVHMLAGGLWIGTLFHLVVIGIGSALGSRLPSVRRGALVRDLVDAFSPWALVSAGLLAGMGVVTAVRHLKRVESLWTTPYGFVFLIKLAFVAGVVALGAWNWRRQKPRLGGETAALELRRSANLEVALAALVLAASAILVSVESPQ